MFSDFAWFSPFHSGDCSFICISIHRRMTHHKFENTIATIKHVPTDLFRVFSAIKIQLCWDQSRMNAYQVQNIHQNQTNRFDRDVELSCYLSNIGKIIFEHHFHFPRMFNNFPRTRFFNDFSTDSKDFVPLGGLFLCSN